MKKIANNPFIPLAIPAWVIFTLTSILAEFKPWAWMVWTPWLTFVTVATILWQLRNNRNSK